MQDPTVGFEEIEDNHPPGCLAELHAAALYEFLSNGDPEKD